MTYIEQLPPRQRLVFAWAILFGLLLLLWNVVIAPLVSTHIDTSMRLNQARLQLYRLEGTIAEAEAQLQTPDSLSAGIPGSAEIWQGENAALVSASLQQLVQSVSSQAGLTLVSVADEDKREIENVPVVGIVVEAFGDIGAFADLLVALEIHRPIVLVDDLLLRRYQRPTGPQIGDRLPLSARFSVFAPLEARTGAGGRAGKNTEAIR